MRTQIEHRAFEGTAFPFGKDKARRWRWSSAESGAAFADGRANDTDVVRKGRICGGRGEDLDGGVG